MIRIQLKSVTQAAVTCIHKTPRMQRCSYSDWPLLNEEHRAVSEMARTFADNELAPVAYKTDREHLFPTEQVKKLGELGLMGMHVSSEFGGSDMDTMSYAIAMEEISRVCASTGVIMSANNSLFCAPVESYGSKAQKEKYLTPWYCSNMHLLF